MRAKVIFKIPRLSGFTFRAHLWHLTSNLTTLLLSWMHNKFSIQHSIYVMQALKFALTFLRGGEEVPDILSIRLSAGKSWIRIMCSLKKNFTMIKPSRLVWLNSYNFSSCLFRIQDTFEHPVYHTQSEKGYCSRRPVHSKRPSAVLKGALVMTTCIAHGVPESRRNGGWGPCLVRFSVLFTSQWYLPIIWDMTIKLW